MKKLALTLVTLIITSSMFAQSFKLTTEDGRDITDTTFVISGAETIMQERIYVENLTGQEVDVMLKRYEVSVTDSTKNYFCWGDCLPSRYAGKDPVLYAFEALNFTVDWKEPSCYIYHRPEGKSGKNTYLYVYYDDKNPDDSNFVEVTFDVATYVGIEPLNKENISFQASPNPASDLVKINYNINQPLVNNAKIVVVDLLGKIQGEYALQASAGNLEIDASRFSPGLYFYSISVGNELIDTKRLVIK